MNQHHLVKHYDTLGSNQSSDFRNYSLRKLIAKKYKGKSLLDIGCGTGFFSYEGIKKGFKVMAIDIERKFLKKTKETCKNNKLLTTMQLDGKRIDKIKEKFDTIIAIDVLEHIQEDKLLIKKIRNRLNNEGRIIIIVPAHQFLYGVRDKNAGHFRRYSKKHLYNVLKNAGFKNIKIRYWNFLGFFPYFFFEKVIHKKINESMRSSKGIISRIINKILTAWFITIENSVSFGFGLSLLAVGEK